MWKRYKRHFQAFVCALCQLPHGGKRGEDRRRSLEKDDSFSPLTRLGIYGTSERVCRSFLSSLPVYLTLHEVRRYTSWKDIFYGVLPFSLVYLLRALALARGSDAERAREMKRGEI